MMHKQIVRSLVVGLLVVMGLGVGVWAQSASLTVTAYSDAVRFSAQGAVKELRVEVLSLSGQKVFDSGPVLSNALDWKLLNAQGQPVANGVYLYTVTIKDPFGNVTKRLGKLAVLRGKGIAAPPLSGLSVSEVAQSPRLRPLGGPDFGTGATIVGGYLQLGANAPAGGAERGRVEGYMRFDVSGSFFRAVPDGTPFLLEGFGEPWNYVAFVSGNSPANQPRSMYFYTGDTVVGNLTLGMYLSPNGNLGIGTTSPSAKTHINNTANQPGLRIDSSAGTNALEIYNTEGGANLIFRVERTTGNVYADGTITGGGADVAERIDTTEPLEAGDVVEIDPDNPGKFRKAREAVSTRVAGVISTAPGVVLGNKDAATSSDTRPILALAGRVPVKVTAKYGSIEVGDLLVSSPIPGYAMKCNDRTKCIGAVIGKALEPLREGVGVIEVQVMLR